MNKLSNIFRKKDICPVCAIKKALAEKKVYIDGADRYNNGTALTPPMGWASWNLFHHNINEDIIIQMSEAIKKSGLKDVGYEYVNVDDCWMSSIRDDNGRLQGDLTTFPSGIKALVEKVNACGLKFGIYASNGTFTCEGLPSCLYNEKKDAETFAEWGVEYFKYDFCHNIPIPNVAPQIEKITIVKPGKKSGISLYASDAELRGHAVILQDSSLTETGHYISGLEKSIGAAVFNHIEVPEDGEYILTLGLRRFKLCDKYLEITVNGKDVYPIRFYGSTGATKEMRNQIKIKLKKGNNVLYMCNPIGSKMDSAAKQYRNMGNELIKATKKVSEETGKPVKPICYSICEWGANKPWLWGPSAGNLWRTTGDITATWSSIINIYEKTVTLYNYSGPGGWNDPDMLEVGNGELNDNENIAHFTLWCMMNAPLILGNDIRKFIQPDGTVDKDNKILKIVSNKKAISINQDKLGFQCRRIKTNGPVDILVKPLENKRIAVCILNKHDKNKKGTFSLRYITGLTYVNLPSNSKYILDDVWENKEFEADDIVTINLPCHSVKLYIISEAQ